MIENLNMVSFSPYGRVLLERQPGRGLPAEAMADQRVLQLDRHHAALYRLDAPWLYLDFEENMTVLVVSQTENPQEGAYFYLDKPVLLSRGSYFALLPLLETATVRYAMEPGGRWEVQPEVAVDTPLAISRQLTIPAVYTIFYQEKEKNFFFKGEHHGTAELLYVDKGALHSVVGGVDTVLTQGNLVVYGPDQWHMQYADSQEPVGFITISFDVQCPFLELLLGRKFSLDSDAVSLLMQILREQQRPDMFSSDLIVSKLEQLLLTVLRMGNPSVEKLRTSVAIYSENQIISSVQSYIASSVYSRLTVSSVAAANNVSASYLTALFQQHLHLPPGEYIRRTKLEESKALIRRGRENFSQIAKALQYASVNHFSRQFKAHFGITPTQYAKSIHVTEDPCRCHHPQQGNSHVK